MSSRPIVASFDKMRALRRKIPASFDKMSVDVSHAERDLRAAGFDVPAPSAPRQDTPKPAAPARQDKPNL
jgi:hypothetical protein